MIDPATSYILFWQIFAVGLVLAAGAYFVFSLIVLRQVKLMSTTVVTEGGAILKMLAWIHSVAALGVILLLGVWLL